MNVGLIHPPMQRNVHINIRIFLAVIIYSFLYRLIRIRAWEQVWWFVFKQRIDTRSSSESPEYIWLWARRPTNAILILKLCCSKSTLTFYHNAVQLHPIAVQYI